MLYRFHPSNNYVRGPAAFPRTPALVFDSAQTLPVISIFGPGVPVMRQFGSAGAAMKPIQPPQVNFRQTWPQTGYGGVSAGMIYGYPLSINSLGQPANPSPQ